jgi:hypothetical protein
MKKLLLLAIMVYSVAYGQPDRSTNSSFILLDQHFSPMLTAAGSHGTLANFIIVNTRDQAPAFLPDMIVTVLKKKGYTAHVSNGPNKLYRDGTYIGKILLRYQLNAIKASDGAKFQCVYSLMIYDVESPKPVEVISDNFRVPGYGEDEQQNFIRLKIADKLGL